MLKRRRFPNARWTMPTTEAIRGLCLIGTLLTAGMLPAQAQDSVALPPVTFSEPSLLSPSGGAALTSAGTQTSNLGAFSIIINPGAGLAGNTAALAAFNRAAAQWAARISDPITVTINANLSNIGSASIIGSTDSILLAAGFTTIRNAMVADAVGGPADDDITAFLPTAATFSAVVPTGFSLSSNIVLTKANAKALGFTGLDASFGVSDGTISFNNQFSFDYDSSDGVGAGLIDFETVAAHEIGHLLGFISSVDVVDANTPGAVSLNPLDLFRFQNNVAGRDPATSSDFSTFPRYLLTGGDTITDTVDTEYRMSTGVATGDGRQASHWKDNDLTGTLIGIMDPTLATALTIPVMDSDFRALSLIGWDVAAPRLAPAAPEPGSLALLLPALGGFGMILRRNRHIRVS